MIQANDLILDKVIFEVRYDVAVLYWDNAGTVLSELFSRFPKFEIPDVSVSMSQLTLQEEALNVSFSHLKCDVSQDRPANTKLFKEVCHVLLQAVQKHLKISAYTRAGLRVQHILPKQDKEEAASAANQLSLLRIPLDRLVPFGQQITEQQRLFRIEDEKRGYMLRVATAHRELTLKLPKPLQVISDKMYPDVVLFDSDVFTKGNIDTSIFVPDDFIRVSMRSVEENMLDFWQR